ncbi:MAG: hypothetical protein ACRD43_07430 [Pyrinomonadaceae bacterium]
MIIKVLACLFAVVVFLVGLYLTGVVKSSLYRVPESYGEIKKQNIDAFWIGPYEGSRIDLSGLESDDGRKLDISTGQELIFISIVDSDCKMSRNSRDLIRRVQILAGDHGIRSFVVSFERRDPAEFFAIQKEAFGTDLDFLLWRDQNKEPMKILSSMVVPSHLLLSADGVILKKFPGTSADENIRVKMGDDIVQEIERMSPR